METRCDTVSGELHATFTDNSPGGSHAQPLIAPPVAQPLAQPAARRWPGTVAGHGRYRRRKQPAQAHHDRPRGHARAHDETTNFNTDFPAPTRRKVTTQPTRFANPPRRHPPPPTPTFPHQQAEKSPQNQHVLSILHVDSNQLQYRFFRTSKPKSRYKTNTFGLSVTNVVLKFRV